jgi:DNA-binding protein HU-beta
MTDPVVAPKTAPKPVITKHLAYELAEQHQLTKKQGLEMMEQLVGMITKHLKKGERVKIAGLGILQVRHAWATIRRPVSKSTSRPAKRSPSAPPRNSRWRSDRQASVAF